MSFNPTFPVSLAAGANSVFRIDPMDTSALFSVNAVAASTIVFESSSDNGVTDPWSPAPALREASLTVDRSDETNVVTLTVGEQYRWRIDAAMPGAYIRVRVVTGSITFVSARSGRFFLDVPNQVVVPVGTLASSAQLNAAIGLLRLILGEISASRMPVGTPPQYDLGDKLLESQIPGLAAALATYNP